MGMRKSTEPLIRVTLNLYAHDYERIKSLHAENYTTFLRNLLRAHLTRMDAQIEEGSEELFDEINLPEMESIDE